MRGNAVVGASLVLLIAGLWLVTVWPLPNREVAVEPRVRETRAVELEPVPLIAARAATTELSAPAEPRPATPLMAAVTIDSVLPEPAEEPNPLVQQRGPVAERKLTFETEPRDSAAVEVEASIRAAFAQPDSSPELVRSVLCRASVCKVEIYWSQDRMDAYIAGVSRAAASFDGEIAISPAELRSDRVRPVEVYLKRRSPSAAN